MKKPDKLPSGLHGGMFEFLNYLRDHCHISSVEAGWWDELGEVKEHLPQDLQRKVEVWFLASKIALIHSEVSEMLEGLRKNCMDDHLPLRRMEEVEGADVLIRLFDYMGRRRMDVAGATYEKMEYNSHRLDHTIEARNSEGGKSI